MNNYAHLQVDLSNCDKEPIHLIGRIQAHGFALVINKHSKLIGQVSTNIEAFVGLPYNTVLHKHLEQAFSAHAAKEIAQMLEQKEVAPFMLIIDEKPFICFTHHAGESIVLEFEPLIHPTYSHLNRLQSFLLHTIEEISGPYPFEELSTLFAHRIQHLLDYDRVMIYQFDEDWHGHVIAEKVKEGVKSYYNHHFPATDIPSQAREMLLQKGIRQISNVNQESIPIFPYLNPYTGSPTDMLATELRNASEIHLEYLKNMHVQASLSIAIIVRAKLWGLVCCHHHSPVFIDYHQRNIAGLIISYYAKSILSSKERQNKDLVTKYATVEKKLIEEMEQNLDIVEGLFTKPVNLLDMSTAKGAALFLAGKLFTLGDCPAQGQIKGIIEWAATNNLPSPFVTRELSRHYPAAVSFTEDASGIMIVELSKHNKDYILWFKPQIKETISWAGNPDKSMAMDGGKKLHPRKSFEKWEQQIHGKSAPWTTLEQERAASLAKTVVSIKLKHQAQKLSILNSQLEEVLTQVKSKNMQLEDFTRIASHNLLSPLKSTLALIDLYKRENNFVTAKLALEKIEIVSNNMLESLQDLHQILQISAAEELKKEPVDLRQLLEKEKQNLSKHIEQCGASIHACINTTRLHYRIL